MTKNFTRREFIKKTAAVGAVSVLGQGIVSMVGNSSVYHSIAGEAKHLSVVTGNDIFNSTVRSVNELGGIEKTVKNGQKVGLLINSAFRHPGTYTHPDVVLAVAKLLMDAGAAEIWCLKDESSSFFKRSENYEKYKSLITDMVKKEGSYVNTSIPAGKYLKKGEVNKNLLECDVLINIPIIKDHTGTKFTGSLKNMMGATNHKTCRFFHFGSNKGGSGWYNDVDFLSQCVVDLNTLRKPDLCIADASKFITTNGPFGPGKMKSENKIIAGFDAVQVDAYGSTLLGLKPENVGMIRMASEQKLGTLSLDKNLISDVAI